STNPNGTAAPGTVLPPLSTPKNGLASWTGAGACAESSRARAGRKICWIFKAGAERPPSGPAVNALPCTHRFTGLYRARLLDIVIDAEAGLLRRSVRQTFGFLKDGNGRY